MNSEIKVFLTDLKSPDAATREFALDRIGELKPDDALTLIIPLLSDTDEEVRSTAAFNLGEVADPAAAPHLINLIESDNSRIVRREAIIALERFRSPEIQACMVAEAGRADQLNAAKHSIAQQLAGYDSGSSVDALVLLLKDRDVNTRELAAESLYKLNRPSLESTWRKALTDQSDIVRRIARKGLADSRSA
jgi:HEAT repeat protein